jgi:hypothetical protein
VGLCYLPSIGRSCRKPIQVVSLEICGSKLSRQTPASGLSSVHVDATGSQVFPAWWLKDWAFLRQSYTPGIVTEEQAPIGKPTQEQPRSSFKINLDGRIRQWRQSILGNQLSRDQHLNGVASLQAGHQLRSQDKSMKSRCRHNDTSRRSAAQWQCQRYLHRACRHMLLPT